MSENVTTEAWLERVLNAAHEVSQMSFSAAANDIQKHSSFPQGREGAFLPVYRGSESLLLGILSDSNGCVALTRALLQMADDEKVHDEDITDAVGEIINILAGVVQRGFDGQGEPVSLGFPVFIRGEIFPPHRSESLSANLNLGPARADIVVFRGNLPKTA